MVQIQVSSKSESYFWKILEVEAAFNNRHDVVWISFLADALNLVKMVMASKYHVDSRYLHGQL